MMSPNNFIQFNLVATSPSHLGQVNCWKCIHFATSWDPKMPYSCKLLGFKSHILPSIQVMNSDGRPCLGFSPKPNEKVGKVGKV
jgi:hypothetical protein